MNKKIVGVLTALLIVTLAVPVFADNHMEDKVKITGDVTTVFDVSGYGDNPEAAAILWADDDVLDENPLADPDLFPAKKAFYQEIGFNVQGMVNDNVTFDLAIDTLTNNLSTVEGYNPTGTEGDADTLGNPGAMNDLVMDNAILTIADDVSSLKLGDINGFHGDVYFVDDEDLEGMELNTAMAGNNVRVFMGGNSGTEGTGGDFENQDFYGVTVAKELNAATLTGKVYQSRMNGESVTDLAVALDADVSETVAINGELVSSDDSNADSGTLMMFGAEMKASDAVTLTADAEMAGEDFTSVAGDLEESNDYDLYAVGAEMALNESNTVTADYTLVANNAAGNPEDKSTIELGLENVNGAYTNNASIAMTANDSYSDNTDITVIKLGTEYAMDAATLTADITNQSSDSHNEFTYLAVGFDQTITENITWNTEFGYLDGTANNTLTDSGDTISATNEDAESTHLETGLTVKF